MLFETLSICFLNLTSGLLAEVVHRRCRVLQGGEMLQVSLPQMSITNITNATAAPIKDVSVYIFH